MGVTGLIVWAGLGRGSLVCIGSSAPSLGDVKKKKKFKNMGWVKFLCLGKQGKCLQ